MRFLLAVLLASVATIGLAQKAALKLKPGDKLSVSVFGAPTYDSECVVLTDGSISGKGFGRLPVEGKTLEQVKTDLTKRFSTFIKNPGVSVVLLAERLEYIYVSGAKAPTGGTIVWTPETNLRQVLATLDLKEDPDLFDVTVYRGPTQLLKGNLSTILTSERDGGLMLRGGDVVAVLPTEFLRVW
ncbi:MAG TPA: polysaccharide biosynthesis/export family protein, partial [Fimbriimonadaceae bacterium]|nr:polysaccharide biosynthesis/export family protein [Fimbriimonadaceae bacterium]